MNEHIKVERLNNIINELEKWLEDVDIFQMNFIENKEHITSYKAVLDKLQELKGVDKDSQDECKDFDKIVYSDDLEKYRQVNGFLNDKGNKIFCQRVHNYLDKKRKR